MRTIFSIKKVVLLVCLLLASCTPTASRLPTPPQPIIIQTSQPADLAPDATRQSTAASATPSLPAPEVLLTPWDDRSVFQNGLVPSEQGILQGLPGASVYHIDLTIEPGLTTLTGQEEIRYTNREAAPLDKIYLRLFPNLMAGKITVTDLKVNGQPADSSLEQQDSALAIPVAPPLAPGESLVLRMAFTEQVPSDSTTGYGILGFSNEVLSLSQFYPLIPVYDEKGWHTEIPPDYGDPAYTDTSFYLVRITAPAELVIAASGAPVQQEKKGDHQTATWASGPARDFYIAASDRYSISTVKAGDTTMQSFAFPESKNSAGQTLEVARQAFESFGKRFGPYPYTYFNIAATATQALGIEYPGEIALNEQLLSPNGKFGNLPTSAYLQATVAHEAAHQWFYGIVGDDQVNQPWLDESMAQYDTYLYYLDKVNPTAAEAIKSDWKGRWARVNDEKTPIGEPVSAYSPRSYGAIVYGRGPLFLDALSQQMGETKFDAFLKDYYQANKWGIATTAGFEQLAQKDCGCNLSQLFKDWIGK